MPVIDANGCSDLRPGRGPGTRAGPDPVQLARHHAAHVGAAGRHRSPSISGWCASTAAATANPACPKAPTPWSMLGRDVLAIMDALGIKKANWCGLSMGGMEGMWLGANAPERFERLVLSNTSSYFPDKKGWNDRLALVREKGVPAFAAPNMERWFTKGFRERDPQAIARMMEMFAATPLDGYIACGEAVRDMDHRELLPTGQSSDAGHHRPPRPRDHAGSRRIHLQEYSGRRACDDRRRAHLQHRAAAAIQRRGAGFSDAGT